MRDTQASAEHNVDAVLHAVDDALDHTRHAADADAGADAATVGDGAGKKSADMGFALFDIAASAASAEDGLISRLDAYNEDAAHVIEAFGRRAKENEKKTRAFFASASALFTSTRAWMDSAKKAWDPAQWNDVAAAFGGGARGAGAEKIFGTNVQPQAQPSEVPELSFLEKLGPLLSYLDSSAATATVDAAGVDP